MGKAKLSAIDHLYIRNMLAGGDKLFAKKHVRQRETMEGFWPRVEKRGAQMSVVTGSASFMCIMYVACTAMSMGIS